MKYPSLYHLSGNFLITEDGAFQVSINDLANLFFGEFQEWVLPLSC